MWSNFNDSFTAITDHISTQIRQTIPTIQSSFGDQSNHQDGTKRELETKISLLRNEVVRHRNIAQTYKERWLEAENVCKQITGNCSKVYDDDVNLLDDDDDEIIDDNDGDDGHQQQLTKSSSFESSTIVDVNEESSPVVVTHSDDGKKIIDDHQTNELSSSSSSSATKKLPKCIANLRLDSAIQQIHRLQDEIRKLQTDGEHWRKLAKQKSSIEEAQRIADLEQVRNELKICREECKNYAEQCNDLVDQISTIKHESSIELQQLDQLHDEEKKKLLALRDQLTDENQLLKLEINELQQQQQGNVKEDSSSMVNICIQTDSVVDDLSYIDRIVRESSKYVDLSELENHYSSNDDHDDDDDRQKFLEKIVELLCKRIDCLNNNNNKMMTTVADDDCESKMTLMTLHPDQMLNHDDENNHSHKKKKNLNRKLNELQSPETEAATLSNQKSIREEPEGANNNDDSDTTTTQDDVEIAVVQKNQLINELETKLASLSNEYEDLCQRYNSSQNENQIFERRFKETEEESVKLQHRLHQTEQERDSLQIQLNEVEKTRDSLQQELENQKAQLISQIELSDKSLIELNQWRNQYDQMSQHLNQLTQDNHALKLSLATKDDELIKLMEKLANLQKSIADQQQAESDRAEIDKLTGELNRLRQHLVQVEETYIGYLKESEERLEQSQKIVQQYEQMNIDQRELEYQELVQSLREELKNSHEQLHQCEDKNERLAANLINMQSVIEQLEKEHERKIRSMHEEQEKQKILNEQCNEEWQRRLQTCERHLYETRKALEAASRLTEQIEQKESMIEHFKREAKNKDQEIMKLQKKIQDIEQSQEGKVDKQIVKNLVLSYLATPMDKRSDGERLLARFLDFNQEEMNRVGIRIGSGGRRDSNSFTSSFVQFLETESYPDKNATTTTTGSHERKSSNIAMSNHPQQMELARDLNKRLSQQQVNPFVTPIATTAVAAATTTTYQHHIRHSRTPSMHSQQSSSSLSDYQISNPLTQNQLLASNNIDTSSMTMMMNIVPPANVTTSTTTTSNITEIIRDVMNKDKII
ncbi:Trip11p [Dermatophagoides farinae]|uniref:Trip11p n=1 Tax=Dermatophagoides farinae TaxID=6954 RepID=A0A922I9E2_DERFA|nr:Trip11p [Dermatophagoides farinae]